MDRLKERSLKYDDPIELLLEIDEIIRQRDKNLITDKDVTDQIMTIMWNEKNVDWDKIKRDSQQNI